MRKQIQLNIPTPCHENWDQMHPVEKGRFCGSCQKQVIDFTMMSDTQLIAFFKKTSTGSVCGRFMQDQLDRTIETPKKRMPWVKYFFKFALPAFLISTKATAQGTVREIKGDTVMVSEPKEVELKKMTTAKVEKRINGKVVNDKGEGISYASVVIKGTTIGVATDSTGNFSLPYSGLEDTVVLIGSSVGFENTESMVWLNKSETNITITLDVISTLGEVVVTNGEMMGRMIFTGGINVSRKIAVIDTIYNAILPARKSLKLYPNPVQTNTTLHIEMSKHEKGAYIFQLSAVNGKVITSKEIWMDKYDRLAKIEIPSVAAGAYFITMINKQSGKRDTEKLIIE